MDSRPLGIAALALATIGAAGVGSYLALRPSQPPATVASAAQPGAAPAAASGTNANAPKPVTETEGTVAADSKADPKAAAAQTAQSAQAAQAQSEPVEAAKSSAAASKKSPSAKSDSKKSNPASAPASTAAAGRGTTPAPVGTMAGRDPYGQGQYGAASGPNASATAGQTPYGTSGSGSYGSRPAGENPANPQSTIGGQQSPVEQAPPPEPAAPPKPRFEELMIPADSVIGLRLEDTISSETARVEDRVEARVSRDVRVNGEIAVPAGTRARGNVTLVEAGGKFKDRARLGVRFHTLVLADGSTIPIQTETIYRDGQEIANKSAAKIGGAAAAGALIGAIFGGGKGAAIGGAAGAGAGTAAAAAGPRSQATLIAGSTVTVRLSNPATVTIEK